MSDETCLICDRPVPDYKPTYCCNGTDCGCGGLTPEPCVCSEECEQAVYKFNGSYEERRIKAGIKKWGEL